MEKIMEKIKLNTYKEARRQKKIYLTMIMFIGFLFFIPLISSFEFDNRKSFDDKIGEYGKVTIKNFWGFPIFGDTLQELELKENTPRCSAGCKADINIELFKQGALVDDVKFLTQSGPDWIKEPIISYRFEILNGTKTIEDYAWLPSLNFDKNGTRLKEYKKIGSHQEENWIPYIEGEEYSPGTYSLKLIGNKHHAKTIDWQITSQGILLEDWALWGAGSGATLYYNFDSDAEILFGVSNLTNNTGFSNFTSADCLIGGCMRTGDGTGEGGSVVINATTGINISALGGTMNIWLKKIDTIHNQVALGYAGGLFMTYDNLAPGQESYNMDGLSAQIVLGNSTAPGEWHMITFFGNTSTFLDGVFNGSSGGLASSGNLFLGINRDGASNAFNGSIDELGFWDRNLTVAEITELYNNGAGIPGGVVATNVNLTTPGDLFNSTSLIVSFNCSGEISGGGTISNMSVWTNDTGTFEPVNSTTGLSVTSFELIKDFTYSSNSDFIWNCEMCNNTGGCEFSAANRSISIPKIRIVDEFFVASTIEGVTNLFQLNITITEGVTLTGHDLLYNNTETNGTVSNTVGTNYTISANIQAPSISTLTNKSFFWRLRLSDSHEQNSTPHNQTITILGIDDCGVFSVILLNYTLKDEQTQATFNGPLFNTSVEIDLDIFAKGSTTSIINFSGNYSENNNPIVCLETSLGSSEFEMDVQTRYSADLYFSEFHNIQNFTLTNDTLFQNISLFDLLIDTSSLDNTKTFLITFKDSNFLPVSDALIDIQRKYVSEGVFKSIEIPKTDDNGEATGAFDLDGALYTILVIKNGVILATFDNIAVVCQDKIIDNCVINLNAFATGREFTDWENVGGISQATSFDVDARTITTIFTTTDGSSQTVLLNATKYDRFGNQTICTDTLISSSGTLTCTIPISFGNVTTISELSVNNVLVSTNVFSITPDATEYFGEDTAFLSLMLVISLAMMFIPSTIAVVIGVILGLIMSSLLLLIDTGSWIGETSSILWLIIAGGIIIWKISNRE